MTLSEELTWRGFVNQTTFENVKALDTEKRIFYFGVDPSAPSMTIGNLASAMMVRVFIQHGYTPILLVGGATGLIGDPDGRTQERNLKTPEEVEKNAKFIAAQYKRIFNGLKFKIVNNSDWFKDINYIAFLRDVGKHVPIRQMLSRDFVQSRLGEDGAGISYAEFSYSLIQGYDFLHLFNEHGVTLQLSGADQWGNSIAGVDLIRRKTGKQAHVWTAPLIINKATGIKFGKSEEGAVWLDANLTSPYKFYQFWLNVDDQGVEDYLKIYTTLNQEKINAVIEVFNTDKSKRHAQKVLAYEVTTITHGKEIADSVLRITDVLFGGKDYEELTTKDFAILKTELPIASPKIGDSLIGPLVESGLAKSNSEARRYLEQNAVYLNGKQAKLSQLLTKSNCIDGRHAILRRGKNNNAILQIVE